jgi:hypothetical protein
LTPTGRLEKRTLFDVVGIEEENATCQDFPNQVPRCACFTVSLR